MTVALKMAHYEYFPFSLNEMHLNQRWSIHSRVLLSSCSYKPKWEETQAKTQNIVGGLCIRLFLICLLWKEIQNNTFLKLTPFCKFLPLKLNFISNYLDFMWVQEDWMLNWIKRSVNKNFKYSHFNNQIVGPLLHFLHTSDCMQF